MSHSIEVYRHAAAKVIARQQSVVADLGEYLKDVESMPYPMLRVVKAVCLLTRTEVPYPDETAAIVAKQFLESSILIKRLAELEEIELPFSTLCKLGEIVAQDEFISISLPQSVLAIADCIKKLYDFQCSSRSEGTKAKDEAWLSPQRKLRNGSSSPVRVRSQTKQGDEPLLVDGMVRPDPYDKSQEAPEDYEQHTKQLEELEARKQRQTEDFDKMKLMAERNEEHQSALKIGADDSKKNESLDKVLQKCNLATRTVKRVTPSDFQRLASFFNCPPCFATYCLALGSLLVNSAPEAFRSKRASLGGFWAGLRLLLSKPPALCQLLSECDAWETSPLAAQNLDVIQETSTNVSQLAQASPAALALANWVSCFSDKWIELGKPICEEERESEEQTSKRQLFTTPMKTTTPRAPRASSRGRLSTMGSRQRSASARARSSSAAPTTPRAGRQTSKKEKEKNTVVKQKEKVELVVPAEQASIPNFEDALLKALIDIRTLTSRDFALLATHAPSDNHLSHSVQATVEGITVVTGLGGETPSDGTVDFWSVGITALQNQPQEVLEALKKLDDKSLSSDIVSHINKLRPHMGNVATPYLAVNVLRSWITAILDYLQNKNKDSATLAELSEQADACMSCTSPSPMRKQERQQVESESFSPPPPPGLRVAKKETKPETLEAAREPLRAMAAPMFSETHLSKKLDEWLEQSGMGKYVPVFKEHEVDMESVHLLRESDLVAMGIPIGPKRKLLALIASLSGQ